MVLRLQRNIMPGTSATMGIIGGTQATMEYRAWYIIYDDGLLAVMFAQLVYAPSTIHMMSYGNGTNANGGLQTMEIIWYQAYSVGHRWYISYWI